MINLYDFIDILQDDFICVIDLNGIGLTCNKNEIKNRFNNDVITRISADFSQDASGDILNVHIKGYCINDD